MAIASAVLSIGVAVAKVDPDSLHDPRTSLFIVDVKELGRPQNGAVFTALPVGSVHSFRSDDETVVPSMNV